MTIKNFKMNDDKILIKFDVNLRENFDIYLCTYTPINTKNIYGDLRMFLT